MSQDKRCEDCLHFNVCERIFRYYFNMAIPDYKPKTCLCYDTNEGEWTGDWDYECSSCHEYNDIKTKYCPNCGAKMKGKDGEGE